MTIHGIRKSAIAPNDKVRAVTVCGRTGIKARDTTKTYDMTDGRRFFGVEITTDADLVNCGNCLRTMNHAARARRSHA